MSLREATPEDADRLWGLRTKAILAIPSSAYNKSATEMWALKPQFPEFKNVIRENYYLVYEDNGRIVGGGFLDLKMNSIEAMYVDPEVQGRGIGKNLLNALLERAADLKLHEVILSSTLNAVPFYQSCGFVVVKASTYKFEDGRELDCVDMKISV